MVHHRSNLLNSLFKKSKEQRNHLQSSLFLLLIVWFCAANTMSLSSFIWTWPVLKLVPFLGWKQRKVLSRFSSWARGKNRNDQAAQTPQKVKYIDPFSRWHLCISLAYIISVVFPLYKKPMFWSFKQKLIVVSTLYIFNERKWETV